MSAREIRLRGGRITSDPRLDRVPQVDSRSLGFPIAEVLPSVTLRSRTWVCAPHLDQGQEGACLPPGTLIRMADGTHRPIESVRALEMVASAEGRPQRVLGTTARFHADGLVRVLLRGHRHLRLTAEHPVLTRRGYVSSGSLLIGDEVALPRYRANFHDAADVLAVAAIVSSRESRGRSGVLHHGGVATEVRALPSALWLTARLGRLIGLWLAEGSTTEQKVVWTFGAHERETLASETAALIRSELGAEPRVQVRPNGVVNVIIYGKLWRLLFERSFRLGPFDKTLGMTMRGPDDYLRGVVDGWLAGDGYRRRTTTHGVTVSHTLALDIHSIAQQLGLRPVIRQSQPHDRRVRFDVEFADGLNPHSDEDAHFVWRRVAGVEAESWAGFVHNLHVEQDESYIAEGIGVHNCVGFGWAHELAAQPVVIPVDDASARAIYHFAQTLDEWPGEAYEGTSVLAGAKACQQYGLVREYRWAFGIDDVLATLSNYGTVVLGTDWLEGMFEPGPSGLLDVSGRVAGGHCYLARGNVLKQRLAGVGVRHVVRLRNSWGPGWGVGGDAYILPEDLERLLGAGGEACIPVDVRRVAP